MTERSRSRSLRLDDLESRITISIEEAAGMLGLDRSATYEAARRGDLPSRHLGRRVVIPVPAFWDWLGATSTMAEL